MAKGCLDKLTGNILVACDLTSPGVSDIYLMYSTDVTFTFSLNNTRIETVTFATGTKSYRVEGYKQNIQINVSLRTTDASSRHDVSVAFKVPESQAFFGNRILSGKFYVLEIPRGVGASTFNVWGVNSPLECSNIEYDSNANSRLVTYTLTAPEGSAGNNRVTCLTSVRDSIIAKSV